MREPATSQPCRDSKLILKRANASRPSGHWSEDDYDVFAEGEVVGRIMKVTAAPESTPWMWTLAYGHHRDRADPRLHCDARGRDGGVRYELAAVNNGDFSGFCLRGESARSAITATLPSDEAVGHRKHRSGSGLPRVANAAPAAVPLMGGCVRM